MKNFILFLVGTLTLSLASCTKEPSANINANKTEVEVNEEISFTNSSQEAESYLWEFGDGTTSTKKEPVKAYSKAGEYNVFLTAYSKNEKKDDRASLLINVKEKEVEENNDKTNEDYAGTYDGNYTGVLDEEGTIVIEKGEESNEIIIKLEIGDVNATISGNDITIPEQDVTYLGFDGKLKGTGSLINLELKIEFVITAFGNDFEGAFEGTKRE